jgi:hypothetical protein
LIDIENAVIERVTEAVKQLYPDADVYSEYVHEPENFPCVFITEADNSISRRFASTSDLEFAADVMYEVNIYANKPGARKTQAKKIASAIDDVMCSFNMRRTLLSKVPNEDTSVYRIISRYIARVSLSPNGEENNYKITLR